MVRALARTRCGVKDVKDVMGVNNTLLGTASGKPGSGFCFQLAANVRLALAPYSLMQVTSDQIRGKLTFWTEIGLSAAWARKPGKSRSDLNPMWTVKGEMARSIFASSRLGLRK